jgi:hypothetical protein
MTTRRWMIAVAVVAVVIGARQLGRKRSVYQARPTRERCAEENCRHILVDLLQAEVHRGTYTWQVIGGDLEVRIERWGGVRRVFCPGDSSNHRPASDATIKRLAAAYLERVTYHRRLVARYERAARHPWLPVGPDPPLPKP